MLRAAVIGTGNMGKNHIRSYLKLKNVALVAVVDTDLKQRSSISEKYRVKSYGSIKQMLLEIKPDLVSVCVPSSSHCIVGLECLANGLNVLVEKPIALTISDAKKLIVAAKKKKLTLMVGHIERYNPAVKKVKELITKGDLGQITAITIRRVGGFPPQIKDANISVDLAIHDIDIANYLLDALPEQIISNKQKYHIQSREDSVEFFMKYKKTSVYIQANWISPVKIRKLTVTGTEGYLEMDYITQKIEFYKSNYSKFKQAGEGYSDYVLLFSEPDKISITVAKKEPLLEELSYFIHAVETKEKIDSSFALNALKIALT